MRLVHFSRFPLKEIESKAQSNDDEHVFNPKPKGLWVSDEDDYGWKQWCESEEFNLDGLLWKHEIILSDKANILYIRNEQQLDAFTNKYRLDSPFMPHISGIDFVNLLKWKQLSCEYDGIIITPYLWDRRLDNLSQWYYGWDCASGCIWNKEAIESFKLI